MTLEELKAAIAKEREHQIQHQRAVVVSGDNGPARLSLVDGVVAILEAQQQKILALESRIKQLESRV